MGACRRALADDDVEFVILERGVEFFFQHRLHAVNFVQKQHLLFAQICEDCGKVALDLQRRPGSLLEAHIELIGNDSSQCCLAEPWRSKQQYVIQRLAAGFSGFEGDGELLLRFRLAMNSPSQRGRSLSSKPCSSSAREALTSRSGELSRAMAMLTRSVAGVGAGAKSKRRRYCV